MNLYEKPLNAISFDFSILVDEKENHIIVALNHLPFENDSDIVSWGNL